MCLFISVPPAFGPFVAPDCVVWPLFVASKVLTAFASPRFFLLHHFQQTDRERRKEQNEWNFPQHSAEPYHFEPMRRGPGLSWARRIWSRHFYIFLPLALIPARLLLVSLGVIAQLCFILPRRNCVMRSRKYAPERTSAAPAMTPQESHYLAPLTTDYTHQILKVETAVLSG